MRYLCRGGGNQLCGPAPRDRKNLAWGTVRTVAQLFLVGYVLNFVFQISNPYLVLLIYGWMVFWAAHAVKGRVREKQVAIFAPTFLSMVASYTAVAVMVTAVIIHSRPLV